MTTIRKVGLLGAGYICEIHARALQRNPSTEIVAVCDSVAQRAERVARKHGVRAVSTTLDKLLTADLDAVHVLLPPDQHVAAAEKVLESGRHALLEKPMGLASPQCWRLVEAARHAGLALGVNHNFLFLRSFERMRHHAANGTLGPLDQITVSWLYPLELLRSGPYSHWMLQDPRNLFFELGPHLLAFVVDLVGPLDAIQTTASNPIDLPGGCEVYRHWHVHGQKDRTSVDIILSVDAGSPERSIVVRGRGAIAKCDFDRDLYVCTEPVGYGVFDNFLTATSACRQAAVGAGRNLARSLLGTVRRTPASDPFAESVARSIGCFYESIDGPADSRMNARFGLDVISQCEKVVAGIHASDTVRAPSRWVPGPPIRKPNILIFGGTGFIGRRLVRALSTKGFGLRVTTRNIKSAQLALAEMPVEIFQGDPADPEFTSAALEGIEYVYYLSRADAATWDDYYRDDVLVTKQAAEASLAAGVRRFIYTGTIASCYTGKSGDVITSDTPVDPKIRFRNLYARSKAECERALMRLHCDHGLPLVIVRPGIVIGQGVSYTHWGVGMFSSATRVRFWGDGLNTLPFVLVDDVASALLLALDAKDIEGQVFLLTGEPLLSAKDYVDVVSRVCGTRLRAKATPIWQFFLSDLVKEVVKHLIKHPNRRMPSYRDLQARSNRARFDNTKAKLLLNWLPAATREELVEHGIVRVVRDAMR